MLGGSYYANVCSHVPFGRSLIWKWAADRLQHAHLSIVFSALPRLRFISMWGSNLPSLQKPEQTTFVLSEVCGQFFKKKGGGVRPEGPKRKGCGREASDDWLALLWWNIDGADFDSAIGTFDPDLWWQKRPSPSPHNPHFLLRCIAGPLRKNAIQRALPLIRRVYFEDWLIGIDDVRTPAETQRVAARSWPSASDEAEQLLTVI